MIVDKFTEYIKVKEKYNKLRLDLITLVKDYYNYNDKFRISHIGSDDYIRFVSDIYKSDKEDDTNEYFYWIEYHRSGKTGKPGKDYDKITIAEFIDIMKFVDDPELYKATSKFNI